MFASCFTFTKHYKIVPGAVFDLLTQSTSFWLSPNMRAPRSPGVLLDPAVLCLHLWSFERTLRHRLTGASAGSTASCCPCCRLETGTQETGSQDSWSRSCSRSFSGCSGTGFCWGSSASAGLAAEPFCSILTSSCFWETYWFVMWIENLAVRDYIYK